MLWLIPTYKTPPELWVSAVSSWRKAQPTADELCFYGSEAKRLIYISEIQESFCQSKLCEVATMLYNCTKKGQIKADESDPKYLN